MRFFLKGMTYNCNIVILRVIKIYNSGSMEHIVNITKAIFIVYEKIFPNTYIQSMQNS